MAAYVGSCLTKHVNDFGVLMVGRLLGGLATSLLFTVFEAWMVSEHGSRGFSATWLTSTFSAMSVANGLTAVASGWAAEGAAVTFDHPVAPFDVSILLLVLGAGVIVSTWTENYGDASSNVSSNLRDGVVAVLSQRRILVVGFIQSLFEASMYTFVFMWTPALEEEGVSLPFGSIFATFMICAAVGGSCFQALTAGRSIVQILTLVFGISAAGLALPAFVADRRIRFFGFLIFEVGAPCGRLNMGQGFVAREGGACVRGLMGEGERVPCRFAWACTGPPSARCAAVSFRRTSVPLC